MSTPKQFLKSRLKESGITEAQAKYAGIESLTADDVDTLVNVECQGFVLTYFDVSGAPCDFYRIRLDEDDYDDRDLSADYWSKYKQPYNTRPYFYFPKVKGVDWVKIANDPNITIVFTEGELKALKATIEGIPTIGLGGIYNWNYSIDTNKGEIKKPIPDFKVINWVNRTIEICFDTESPAEKRATIKRASEKLGDYLETLGADVYKVELPL